MDGWREGGRDRLIRRLGYLRFLFYVWDKKRGRGRKIGRNKEREERKRDWKSKVSFRRWFRRRIGKKGGMKKGRGGTRVDRWSFVRVISFPRDPKDETFVRPWPRRDASYSRIYYAQSSIMPGGRPLVGPNSKLTYLVEYSVSSNFSNKNFSKSLIVYLVYRCWGLRRLLFSNSSSSPSKFTSNSILFFFF